MEKETRWNSGAPMTDEERKRLCAGLRHAAAYNNPICDAAAEEIEWLAALAQSNVEPVACAIANRSSELGLDADGRVALHGICQEELGREAPPRPDASAGHGQSLIKGERGGISWGGFYVEGDRKSIDAVRDAFHAKERCEALDRMISEKQLVRPDASAGLIEAADLLESVLAENDVSDLGERMSQAFNDALDDKRSMNECHRRYMKPFIDALRARAADRSGE